MASEWAALPLGEVITLQRGFDLPVQNRRSGKFPIVSSSGISGEHSEARVAGPGVVTGRYGTIGQVFYIDEDFWPLNTTLFVSDFKGNDPRFMSYLLKTIDFESCSDKSSVPGVNRNDLHRLRVSIPPLSEQRAIARILGALDDKIELNRRMNETLESIARALFQSWFVDFDPVRAKAEGRLPAGVDATAALFPNAFEESPLGPIPRGWRVAKANTVLSISRDGLNPGDWPNEVFDHYSIPAYDEGRLPKEEAGAAIKSNKSIVGEDAVLISKLNPHIPRVWLPSVSNERRSVCSTEFLVTCPSAPMSREYLYGLLSSTSFLELFGTLVTGTSGSHQRVQPESLLNLDVVVPGGGLIERFSGIGRPLHDRTAHNLHESRTLAAIRDALLPKLLSGAVRVREAEMVVEEIMA